MKSARKTKGTAAENYAKNEAAIRELLGRLGSSLRAHSKSFRKDAQSQNWGYCGELGHLKGLLAEAVEFMGGNPKA